MVRPSLENRGTVWDPYKQNHIKAIEQVQRRAARFVLDDYSTKTPGYVTNMLSYLNWESLKQRRRYSRLSICNNCLCCSNHVTRVWKPVVLYVLCVIATCVNIHWQLEFIWKINSAQTTKYTRVYTYIVQSFLKKNIHTQETTDKYGLYVCEETQHPFKTY